MNILNILNLSKKSATPCKPIANKAKTERKYEPAHNVVDFLRAVESHGDRVAYEYFVSSTETATLTYTEFAAKIRAFSAALTANK